MCEIVERLCRDREAEGIEKGIEKGIEQEKEEMAVRSLRSGRSLEDVCDFVDRSPATVRAWAKNAGIAL